MQTLKEIFEALVKGNANKTDKQPILNIKILPGKHTVNVTNYCNDKDKLLGFLDKYKGKNLLLSHLNSCRLNSRFVWNGEYGIENHVKPPHRWTLSELKQFVSLPQSIIFFVHDYELIPDNVDL